MLQGKNIMLIAVILLGVCVLVFVYLQFFRKSPDSFAKYLRTKNIKHSGKTYKYALTLDDDTKDKVMHIFSIARNLICSLDGDPLEIAIYIANENQIDDYDKFFYSYALIRNSDPLFGVDKMIYAYKVCKGDDIEAFARSWADQVNAELNIDFDTAMEFVSKGRDFPSFVNLDIMAKRAELEIDEKRLINDIDDEGLKIIIYSLIRAKYEGIYMSDEESSRINKANVLEYNDTFKITINLLKNLYSLKRDINRFTNVMIRAHNSGIKINFSLSDLYSLSDDQFDILVTNIIKASDRGISIDQKDLIRQNIQGNDITNLVMALIKANEFGLDLTPDELMNYLVNTRADVVKFVKAYNFAVKNKIISEDGVQLTKDNLVEYSRPEADLFDYVQGLKIAKDLEKQGLPDYGITYPNLKKHFKTFGHVLDAINAVMKAHKAGLNMSFELAGRIIASEDYTLASAVAWAQNPQVIEVTPSVTCVCKNGVQITPKVNITVRGKMPLIFSGYGLDILFKRINEAIIMELESSDDHEHILQSLPEISQNVLNRINEEDNREIKTDLVKETELNNFSRYQLLDVNIYDLTVGQNIKAELELRQAQIQSEMRKLKAEADRAKAEADIRIAMVQQYKDGVKPNFNELHKANLLEEKKDGIATGYDQ